MQIADKTVVITGAASGIGAATARAMARLGARVAVLDINADGAQTVAGQIGGLGLGCDIADEAALNQALQTVQSELGDIDILFNNAGVATGGNPLETSIDVWHSQWDINVMSHIYAIRAVLPRMLERGSGYIVHTASMAGILTTHGNLTYAATKHAVVGIAEWMSITYHDKGVHTSLLAPLGVRTPMLGDIDSAFATQAAGPIKEPEEVAQMVIDAITEERFLILTDPIAQTWMDRKHNDPERWLDGMRRLQRKMDEQDNSGG